MNTHSDCPLCNPGRETVLWRNPRLRIIAVCDEADTPAFCRVIWQAHVAEMTDLTADGRSELMDAVYRTEAAMRQLFRPAKINLASLGNLVPHLHWHVIARFGDDPHFPAPVWAPAKRPNTLSLPPDWPQQLADLLQASAPATGRC